MRAGGFALRERKQYELDNFAGFDFSNSPISASERRATNGKNFFKENGINQKRPGWIEKIRILKDGRYQRINGIWHFSTMEWTDEERTQRQKAEFLIVHAGKHLYEVDLEAGSYQTVYDTEVADERSYGIYNDGKLYVLCGDYLVFGQYGSANNSLEWRFLRVFNAPDAFVPKTRINIGYLGEENDITKDYDKPNLLCTRRQNGFSTTNKLLNEDGNAPTEEKPAVNAEAIKKYRVDTQIIDNGLVTLTVQTLDENSKIVETVYRNAQNPDGTYGTELKNGATKFATVNFDAGIIELVAPQPPLSENSRNDNMTVEFEYQPRDADGKILEGYEEYITKCRFGARFGNGGVDDRLFLSGNADYPNLCFHSGINDYTYFSDEDIAVCGTDSSSITAFSRLGDGTLAIHKEANGQDISIYYRTGETREETEKDGTVKRTEIFPVKAGAIGEGVVTPWACANFSGDNLMLSPNGLYGLVLSSNVATDERYARERSRTINEKLLKNNLSDAVAVVYKNRYYLSVGSECYVADARYTYRGQGDMADTYNYEWWYWENIPARVWEVIGDELYFGTTEGQICVFDGQYSDRIIQNTENGDMALDLEKGKFYINASLFSEMKDADLVTLSSANKRLFTVVAEARKVRGENDRVFVDDDKITIPEESIIFVDKTENAEDTGLVAGRGYTVKDVIYDENGRFSFALYFDNELVKIPGSTLYATRFRLCKSLEGRSLETMNVLEYDGETSFQVREVGGTTALVPVLYNEEPASGILAEMCFRQNVLAEWYTPMLDLGNNSVTKRLRSINIVTEPYISGKVKFGYVTKSRNLVEGSLNLAGFSFEHIDFTDFTFNINNFATTYVKRVNERYFNYIMLRVVSDSDANCAINSIGLEYIPTKKNKGVK